jgi:ubiquinone biosynthesis protein Coq4
MSKLLEKINAARAFATLVKNPLELADVFSMASSLLDDAMAERFIARVSLHEQGRAALTTLRRLGTITVRDLEGHAPGTLGHAYREHLTRGHIVPEALPVLPSPDARAYLLAHVYECHDLWHVVTGFGTSLSDEMGLQAFSTAQGPTKGPWAIVTAGFLHTLLYDLDHKDAHLRAVARGWLLGRRARMLWGVDWRARLATPLVEVRNELHIDLAGVERALEEEGEHARASRAVA